jgi:PPOX class probable F420-dependent enzyme
MTMTETPHDRQRRGRKIAMTTDEADAFLAAERTCRVATVGADGSPHVAPLWFVWDGTALWLNSIVKSQRWADLVRDPRVGVVIDAGEDYMALRGIELSGRAEIVGDVPRTDTPDAMVADAERMFAEKYTGGAFAPDGRHAWMRIVPDRVVSWDFRKLASL